MNDADSILNTNEVFTQQDNTYQSLLNIYLEIALRKAALASVSNRTSLENASVIEPDVYENQHRASINIPPISFPSPLSYPYPGFTASPASSPIPISFSSQTKNSGSFISKNNSLHKTYSYNTSVSTPPVIISSSNPKSNVGDLNNPINLLSILNQNPPSWNSIQNLVQSINKEISNNFVTSTNVNSSAVSASSSTKSGPSSSNFQKLSRQNTITSTDYTSNFKEKEDALEQFRQQQINQINQLNNRLMNYVHNIESNNNEETLKVNYSKEDNTTTPFLGSPPHISSPSLAQSIAATLYDTNASSKYEYKKNYRNSTNPLSSNHPSNNNILSENEEEANNYYMGTPVTISRGVTVDDKSSSNQKNEYRNTSLLEAVDDDHLNNIISFNDLENKLIIDIPIEINPVIEKIRGLRKKSENQQILSKISDFCDEKLKKIASTLFLNIEINITNILVLAPFVLSKVSYILDPTYSHDIINSSTASNFTRSTTSLQSYTKIILALHDTWYLNGPQDIDIKVTQGICTKLLEAISSIRRKVDRIKLSSEGQEAKNNLQASYPQLISTCYFYVTLLDDLMNSIVKIDKMATSSSLSSKNPDPDALINRQRHPPRGESLALQYKLTENSQKIENYINRIEIGSKKSISDKSLKTINSNVTKDTPTNDILSMSYINNKNKGTNNLLRNDHIYMQDNTIYKKHSTGSKSSYSDVRNNEKLNEKLSCPEFNDDNDSLKRRKYATFINLDNENILQKYKSENNIIEEEPEEQENMNENEAFYISHIKNYVQEEDYEPSSNQSTPLVGAAETASITNEVNSITSNKKLSKIYTNTKEENNNEEFDRVNENDEAYYSYILQKNRRNKYKGRNVTKINNTPEIIPARTEVVEENTTENDVGVDNEMSYYETGNKTMTIYKNTNNSELKVHNLEQGEENEGENEGENDKHDHKKNSHSERSYKKKLLRYERKQIKKEIEASEKRAIIFDDIKYFRRHQNSFNIKNVISSSSESTSDSNYFNNKYVMNKGVIYLFEEGREVLGFEITSEKIGVVSGTVEKLLLRLANESTYDEEYVDTFLQYHQFFISSVDLMHNLIARFNVQLESKEDAEEITYNKWRKQIQLKVIHALNHWVTIQYSCFAKNGLIHGLLEYFISAIWSAGYKNEADRIKRNATNIILSSSVKIKNLPFNLIPILPLKDDDIIKEITINLIPYSVLYDYDSKTIARYLCVVDQEIFSVVTWHDIASKLSNSYKNEAYEILKPSLRLQSEKDIEENKKYDENPIDLMTKRSNLIRNWVAMEICSVQNIKTRKYLIRKFIEIAKYCRELNNFHSALFIVSGLLSPPVQRLKQTWELLNNKEMSTLNNLEKLLSPVSNMKYYRKAIALAKGPVVPFFPIIMKDFRFIIDGNPTFKTLPSGVELVNFERYKIMNKILKTIKKYSNEKYPFTAAYLPVIQRLPSLMEKNNRVLLTKDYLSDPRHNSSGSTTFINSNQQNYRISPRQGAATPSISDAGTVFSPEMQSPTLHYTNSNRSILQSNQSLFSLNLNPHHSFQNLTSNFNTLFHSHSNSSLPSNDIENIAVYIESRLYGKGFCTPSSPSVINTNSVGSNTQFSINESDDAGNSVSLDDNILTHILCSEFEIQNQKIAYDLSLACEPPTTIPNSSSPANSSDSSELPSSVKISYQKYINDTNTTRVAFISNNLNEDSLETSLAEKSLSIILNTNPKIKNYDFPGNENNQTILNGLDNKIESENEMNPNLSKIIPNDIHNIPSSSNPSS